ncbi:CRISPR-associated endonuclease Cas2 [Porphyromonas sp. COT-239 OH1446]|uniref:CRISPR-associated endonuclease Cas2 n=1 Tax=Porphyromonas sp. COT-239 OH1446 TaxID=1515613 RepID=UPI00052DDEC3|nr:CRISPR-associated endonuclease Cas2 [Porphyromonas sp. COT-239 OH1446]KGN72217.1 CRISPR-associated protein Cas2 [Porphyromonas sp. COT-239 OH1446]
MYLLITYDVCTSSPSGAKRLRQVARICQNYGQRVQNSVFECLVEPAQFVSLQHQLLSVIDKELDSLRIYHLGNNYKRQIFCFGKVTSFEIEGELII